MKIKLAIFYGVLIWIVTYLISLIINPVIIDNTSYINLITPIIIIIVTGFFGILYIREIKRNEVIKGFIAGIIFVAVDTVLDILTFIVPLNQNILLPNHMTHIILMSIIMISITTFIGYLAQMKIELK